MRIPWRSGGVLFVAIAVSCAGGNLSAAARKAPVRENGSGLRNVDILVIRHAEKPASGPGLSPPGVARAEAYVKYFQGFAPGSRALTPDCLIAAADSAQSSRPRLTLEPLARALNLPLNRDYGANDIEVLGRDLHATRHGNCLLICWRHGGIPKLLTALGAKPADFLGAEAWPEEEYGWVIHLRYDADGRLVRKLSRRIIEPVFEPVPRR